MTSSEEFRVKKLSNNFAKTEPIVLHKTGNTALVFHPEVHSGGVRGSFIRWKKDRSDTYQQIKEKDFRSLKLDEGVKIEIKTEELSSFIKEIQKHYSLIGKKSGKYRIIDEDDKVFIVNDENKSEVIQQVIKNDFSEELWRQLQEANFDLATSLSMGHLQSVRQRALSEFEKNLPIKGDGQECYWQSFFEKNQWIFGYGLSYKFLNLTEDQPCFGGTSYTGKGSQRGDLLCSTAGDISFTVIVELKTPATPLLQGTSQQRNGAWSLSKELVDAVTQTQAYCSTWERSSHDNAEDLEEDKIYTTKPKGIIVVGSLSKLAIKGERATINRIRRETFERFRQSLSGIEILTYDELLKRAQYIVTNS